MKYYTVIVVKIDAFESQIINERHPPSDKYPEIQ